MASPSWLSAGRIALGALALLAIAGCRRGGGHLAPADAYLVFEPAAGGSGAVAPPTPTPPPTSSAVSADAGGITLPRFRPVPLEDARAAPIHKAALAGFLGEILRTDYLAKQLIRDGWQGHAFSPQARARAAEPTVLVLAGSRALAPTEARLGVGFEVPGSWGRGDTHAQVTWIDAGEDPSSDPAFVQTASARIARLVAERLTTATSTSTAADRTPSPELVEGYAWAMEVIGREWRVGEGPRGTLPPDAGTHAQRERFALVRQNGGVRSATDPNALLSATEMVRSPSVIAAVIYRLAQARTIGHRVGPKEIYAPFVDGRIPSGVSPAAVLGPVRNFQAKLLVAWAVAILSGRPPRDIVDLVEAYMALVPGERAEVIRIFVVTTFGATVKAGGVSPRPDEADKALATLTALAAEVSAGRRTLREALGQP